MPETVTVLSEEGIVKVQASGIIAEDELMITLGTAMGMLRDSGLSRILLDARDLLALPPSSILYEYVESILKLGLPRTTMFALVGNRHVVDELQFMETVAINRGFPMRLFPNIQEAMNWLEGEAAKEAL